ncbi:tetraacyldisaccharide 4'-kinase [Ruminobacter sp.]|uniref:tetraacyldisaccharide 4'-kinase n=1 Tax=Ruminobacter sp. TaxID=2774296 RepID=UPI00386C7EF9
MSLENRIKDIWFGNSCWKYPLLPLSALYAAVTSVRRFLYRRNILKSYRSSIPVIVVGNIMVGGNGKTPVVVGIADYFRKNGFRVAVVSRGYKAHPPAYPYEVTAESPAEHSGDEPKLILKRTGAAVIIDPVRSRAAALAEKQADVIITDDGLQHYALKRDVEIIVMDGIRRTGNGHLFPAGPLREGEWRLRSADYLINNGGEPRDGEIPMKLEVDGVLPVDETLSPLPDGAEIIALAGIGSPARFYDTLSGMGYRIVRKVEIGDHEKADISLLLQAEKDYPLVMTEKDFVKYAGCGLKNSYYVPVSADLPENFYGELLSKVKQLSAGK